MYIQTKFINEMALHLNALDQLCMADVSVFGLGTTDHNAQFNDYSTTWVWSSSGPNVDQTVSRTDDEE